MQPMPAEKGDVQYEKRHQRSRQHPGVQSKEASERVVAVFRSPTTNRCNCSPTTGTILAMFVATIVAQYPF